MKGPEQSISSPKQPWRLVKGEGKSLLLEGTTATGVILAQYGEDYKHLL